MRVIAVAINLQRKEVVLFGLLPLPLLFGHPAQLVIGAGLLVPVVELDLDFQRLLVVLFGLLPLPLLLGQDA